MENKEFEKSKVLNIEHSIDYASDSIVSKTVIKKETGNISLFSFYSSLKNSYNKRGLCYI